MCMASLNCSLMGHKYIVARYKEQTMQLDMAKQQREMMITSQAAEMTMSANQHKMQMDMQTKMARPQLAF